MLVGTMMASEVPTHSCMRTLSGTSSTRNTSNSTGTITAPPPTPNNPANRPVATPATPIANASHRISLTGCPRIMGLVSIELAGGAKGRKKLSSRNARQRASGTQAKLHALALCAYAKASFAAHRSLFHVKQSGVGRSRRDVIPEFAQANIRDPGRENAARGPGPELRPGRDDKRRPARDDDRRDRGMTGAIPASCRRRASGTKARIHAGRPHKPTLMSDRRVFCRSRNCATLRHERKPPRPRDQPLPPAAQGQPRALVGVGPRGAGRGQARQQADPALRRLCRLPLVPRHGARELRERRHRRGHERPVREHQGRPRGAPRHRRHLHARAALPRRAGRLAAHHVPRQRCAPVLGRHLFPADAALRPAGLSRRLARGRPHLPR